ncbi:hypothetical protein ONZ45_g18309 [Pleurotus djamor]|nr:hypothetical protein ONZ45_g18309 [Pleurotus djamor]
MSAFLHPDESDLSEVTESEDEGPSAKREPPPKPPKVKRVPFTPFLEQPRAHNCTIKTLFEYMNNGTIDLNPVYQRDVVWENEQQSYLIDSLLNNYQIGNIIWGKSDDGERYIMTCIDGKQRLTSILRFMRGEIPSINPNTKDEIWYPAPHLLENGHPSGKSIKVLNQKAMHQWDSLTVGCAEYDKLEDKMEREIFRRVQMGVPLTGQERMQALSTWRANLVLAFKKTFFHDETGFSPTCPDIWDTKRGIDFSALAAIVYMIDRHNKGITDSMNFVPSFTNLQSWLGDNSQATEIPESSAAKIFIALHVYLRLATSEEHKDCFKLPEVRKAAASSVTAAKYTFGMKEFGSIGYFIWRWMDEMSLTQLADAVKRVRKQIGGIRTQFYAKLNQRSWIKGIKKESPTASQEIKATLPQFSLKAFLAINDRLIRVLRGSTTFIRTYNTIFCSAPYPYFADGEEAKD